MEGNERKYQPEKDELIDTTVDNMLKMANETKGKVSTIFNGIPISVSPGDDRSKLLEDYDSMHKSWLLSIEG